MLGAAVVVASGCAGGTEGGSDLELPPTAPSESTTTSSAAGPSTTLVFEERIVSAREVDETTDILSPTGNIYCVVAVEGYAQCGVLEQDWEPPPQPADCPLDWGATMSVGVDGAPADFNCAGDSSYGGPDSERLPYGHALRAGGVVCLSEESGMTCLGEESRRGFTISRADYRLF
ncbi:MAG: DUF6636 domain-containing protein [Microthrixaceae bacterium]